MSAPIVRGRALVRQRVLGLVFLVVLALLVELTVLLYQKAFTASDTVLLKADRVGNQLTPGADVKLRGLIVGRVEAVRTSGTGATLVLAMDPDKARLVPADVTAQLLPKTLFGEKFVALSAPAQPSGRHLQAGDVIGQDRSRTAIETEKVLGDLLPLLQTLRPQQLSLTLNAVSGALRGRGERTGRNLAALDTYLRQINPEVPGIQDNLRGLADLAENYDDAAPDVLATLDNFSALSRDLQAEKEQLDRFLRASAASTDEVDGFLRDNEQRLVRLAADSKASLGVYARYAPEYPCLAAGLVEANTEVSATFGGRQPGLHITLITPNQDNGPYVEGDEPKNGDDGGPTCRGLPPNPKEIPFPVYRNGTDGYRDGQPVDPRTGEIGPGQGGSRASAAADPARFLTGDLTGGDALTRAVIGTVLAQPADQVPDIAVLLFGPMARGTTVTLS